MRARDCLKTRKEPWAGPLPLQCLVCRDPLVGCQERALGGEMVQQTQDSESAIATQQLPLRSSSCLPT